MIIGRLAIARDWQGQGLGTALLRDAALRTLTVADVAGVRALLVHALDEKAEQFYECYSFNQAPTDPLMLIATLKDIRAVLAL